MLKKLFEISNTLNSIANGIAAHGFNADEYYKACEEMRDVTHKIFMAVIKTPKLKELKIDDESEDDQTSESEKQVFRQLDGRTPIVIVIDLRCNGVCVDRVDKIKIYKRFLDYFWLFYQVSEFKAVALGKQI